MGVGLDDDGDLNPHGEVCWQRSIRPLNLRDKGRDFNSDSMSKTLDQLRGQFEQALPNIPLMTIVFVAIAAVFATLLNRIDGVPPDAYVIFYRLFLFNDYYGSLAMLAAFVCVLRIAKIQALALHLVQWVGEHPRETCLFAFLLLALGARFVYIAHPLSMDEYVPVMQANAFARGELAMQYPLPLLDQILWQGFRGSFFLLDPTTGTTASGYWPGLAMLMTPFVFVNAPWLLNPLLSVLALALIGDLASNTTSDPQQARSRRGWAMVACIASPVFTVNAMSFYAMPGLLAFNLLFLWLLLRPSQWCAFGAGLAGSMALVLHNPVPHALTAAPCFLWMMADQSRRARLPAFIAGYLPLTVVLGIGWPMLTASLHMARDGVQQIQQSFIDEWVQRAARTFQWPSSETLDARRIATWKVWIWAAPGLALAPLFVRPLLPLTKLLLATFLLTYFFYFLFPADQGHGWGYRYIHPAWAAIPVAASIWITRSQATRTLGAVAVAAGLMATPAFLWQTHQTVAGFLSKRIDPPKDGRWIVFIDTRGAYLHDLVQNPTGRDRVMYLSSQGDDQDEVLMRKQFPFAVREVRDQRGSAWRLPAALPSATDKQLN